MRHVLFVDDESAVLSGLRRLLHSMRSQWKMSFAVDGETALANLEQEPADVVVADMRMPGMDGAALLTEVRNRWPETVRIVLSGFADEGAALRSVPVAHRFLSKPCDSATLIATIAGSFQLQDRLAKPELRQLIGKLGALPSAPRSFTEITEALGKPDAGLDSVSAIIEQDAGCSTKLLQLVNSAFFGLARTVTRVHDAVAYLGVARVRDVVMAAEVYDSFNCSDPDLAAMVEEIHDFGAAVSMAARERVAPSFAHDAYVAGVLHDVGRLALAVTAPEQYKPIVRRYLEEGGDLPQMEIERLGATHTDVGAYLLHLWGLPYRLVNVAARHHDTDAVEDPDPVLAAVASTVLDLVPVVGGR